MNKAFYLIMLNFLFIVVVEAQVAVIAHPSVAMDQITRSELLDLYTGDVREWPDGARVILFDQESKSEIKESFYSFLGKSITRMKSIWMKRMLSGEGDPPESLKNDKDVIEKVASTPGAIGFIDKNNATGKVKILIEIRIGPED